MVGEWPWKLISRACICHAGHPQGGFHSSRPPRTNNLHDILIADHMAQAHPLRHMLRALAPHQRILERLLHAPVDGVAHILDAAPLSHDQRFAEIRLDPLPLRVDAHEVQVGPAALDHVGDAEVQLAGHDDGVGFAREGVEEGERDGVDFVVDVEAGLRWGVSGAVCGGRDVEGVRGV